MLFANTQHCMDGIGSTFAPDAQTYGVAAAHSTERSTAIKDTGIVIEPHSVSPRELSLGASAEQAGYQQGNGITDGGTQYHGSAYTGAKRD